MMRIMISKDIYGNEYDIKASELTWRPSAYGIVLHDNKILLNLEAGKYHLPGGGIELDETPEEAVVRELKEETGIDAISPTLIDVKSSYFSWESLEYPGTIQHIKGLLLYYACDFNGGELGNSVLDAYEIATGLTSEWVDLAKLDEIPVGTTVDWRDVVKKVMTT